MNRLFVTLSARETSDVVFGEHRVYDMRALNDRLRGSQVGRSAIILASTTELALWTAQSVKDTVGVGTIVRCPFMEKAGNNPAPVENLWALAENILKRADIDHTGRDVVAITHEPLVQLVAKPVLEQGQIYAVTEDWQNPSYNPGLAYLLENPDQWR